MKKLRNVSILLMLVLFVSCNIELPVPIVGCYRVAQFEEETFDSCYLQLKDDGTFILGQAGGATEERGFIFTGNWDMEMTAYDFKRANGKLYLTNVKGPSDDFEGLFLTAGARNSYKFTWIKNKDTADATLALESIDKYICRDIATGFLITEKTFNAAIEIIKGGNAK